MYSPFLRAAALALLLACAPRYHLPAVVTDKAVRESRELHPYFVSGEARRGVARNARTSWQVQYDFSLAQEGGACRLREPHVTLEIQQWYPVANPQDVFAGDLNALERHEEGHLRIDRAAAHSLAEALRRTSPRETCDAVREEARRAAALAIQECKASNAAYDAATNHGTR